MDGKIKAAASDPTTGRRSGRNGPVQVIARMSVKRAWTTSQKMAISDEAFAPGASVSRVAQRYKLIPAGSTLGGGFSSKAAQRRPKLMRRHRWSASQGSELSSNHGDGYLGRRVPRKPHRSMVF